MASQNQVDTELHFKVRTPIREIVVCRGDRQIGLIRWRPEEEKMPTYEPTGMPTELTEEFHRLNNCELLILVNYMNDLLILQVKQLRKERTYA